MHVPVCYLPVIYERTLVFLLIGFGVGLFGFLSLVVDEAVL